MRPAVLEMQGFGSFRERTVVDFRDVDYFALVGPTGSGKSTVIDAVVFALYGSVPRWDDRRSVSHALAPTVARGTVKLVFDVSTGGSAAGTTDRYVVARELRRSARGAVTTAGARLERLLDPAGTAQPGDPTAPLAADGEVTPAVEALVGLSFEHFCRSVVLPQGDFAEFLHARPAERQAMLSAILGYQVYEEIGRRAGAEAREFAARADALDAQVARYAGAGDASDEAVAAAGAVLSALERLQTRMEEDVARLRDARDAVEQARARTAVLEDERALLAALAPPAGLDDLRRRDRAARGALAVADAEVAEAETRDSEAREVLAAAPDRAPLDAARRDHEELARLLADEPALRDEALAAAAAAEQAREAADSTRAALTAARATTTAAEAAVATVGGEVTALEGERLRVAAVRRPDDLDEIADRVAMAAAIVAESRDELARAERAAASAAAENAEAAGLRPDLAAALVRLRERGDATERLAGAEEATAAAEATLAAAEQALAAAGSALREAEDEHAAAALRAHLAPGQVCPVCEQTVAVVPATEPARDLDALRESVADASRSRESALANAHAARATTDAVHRRLDELAAALHEGGHAGSTVAQVEASLARIDAVAERAATAAERRDRIRSALAGVEAAAADAREVREQALRALVAVAAGLAELGAPPAGDDLVEGWDALVGWAATRTADTDRRLARARDALATAGQGLGEARQAEARAAAADAAAHATARDAERADAGARARVHAHRTRIGDLREALAGAPAVDAVATALAELDRLAGAAAAAARRVTDARDRRRSAATAAEAVRRETDAARSALRGARDTVVALGAPAVDEYGPGADLTQAWAVLVAWAGEQAAEREGRSAAARRLTDEALDVAGRLAEGLVARLREAGVDPPPADRVADDGPAAVASALGRARAELHRVTERRDQAAGWATERDAARAGAEVARELARLLRSDGFPSWLVGSALDVLVAEASRTLLELSGGQYSLASQDRTLVVVDHADADSRRAVRTLSGGETFQASLALALALSSQLPALAASGAAAARLESIVLDEGFGTLDESTLETVASTLEGLAATGGRMVGLVTHVPGLAERVPVRYRVTRAGTGSTVEREQA